MKKKYYTIGQFVYKRTPAGDEFFYFAPNKEAAEATAQFFEFDDARPLWATG